MLMQTILFVAYMYMYLLDIVHCVHKCCANLLNDFACKQFLRWDVFSQNSSLFNPFQWLCVNLLSAEHYTIIKVILTPP